MLHWVRNSTITIDGYMVQHCVVKFSSNSDKTGHSVHKFPGDPVIRRQWVAFVKVKRADFSECCVGAHFTRER